MKKLIIWVVSLLIYCNLSAQDEKRPMAIVLNNGPAFTTFSFKYLPNPNAPLMPITYRADANSFYYANPALRLFRKRGFTEIGINNLQLGVTNLAKITSAPRSYNSLNTSFFRVSMYFNQSYNLFKLLGGQVIGGVEPLLSFYGISQWENYDYILSANALRFDLNFVLRWEETFREKIILGYATGLSPFTMKNERITHKLFDPNESQGITNNFIGFEMTPVVQLYAAIKI